jgi:hypothetical protein
MERCGRALMRAVRRHRHEVQMENALYYTLSTIAQSLAAAFALLGAFVLFRLQHLSSVCASTGKTVIRPYLPNETARFLLANGDFEELSKYLATQQVKEEPINHPHSLEAARDAFGRAIAHRADVVARLRRAMITTGGTLVFAIAGLSLAPIVAKVSIAPWVVLAVGIANFCVCLAMYGRMIWVVTSDA